MTKQTPTDNSTTTESSTKPETGEKKSPKSKEINTIGMTPYKWAGVDAWLCNKCKSSTTNPDVAKVHVCKEIKFENQGE